MIENLKSLLSKIYFGIKIFILITMTVVALHVSSYLYDEQTKEYKHSIYTKVNDNILSITKILLEQKKNASITAAITMAANPLLVDIVFGKRYVNLNLNKFSSILDKNTQFRNVWFSVIDADGNIIKRSWTSTQNDNLANDSYIREMLIHKQPKSVISVNKFGLLINNMVPIMYDGDFIGILNVITHFDSIVKEIESYGFRTVVLIDEEKSDNIDIKESLSKQFISNNYVANTNANDISMKIIHNRGAEYYIDSQGGYDIHEETNSFETTYKIMDKNNHEIGHIILLKALDEINMGDLEINQQAHAGLTIFIILSIGLILYYRKSSKYIAKIKLDNEKLMVVNSEINDKNDKLDFNEKKIANIFHIQPNFMLISDGQSIESANARFLWFFSTYYEGGLEEFRKHHRCISDLFIPCEDSGIDTTDYISGNTIEGMPWKDYILKNYKRQYKVCMKDGKGDLHHFIIKMTEMEYAKLIKRYIVISFIDITHEIQMMKKSQEKQAIIMELTKIAQIGEMITHISNQCKQPLRALYLSANMIKSKKENGILNDDEINSFTKNIENNSELLTSIMNNFTSFIKNKAEAGQIDLVQIVNMALKIVSTTYKSQKIILVKHLCGEQLIKTIIPSELSQVIMNIMTNSKDALIKLEKQDKWIEISVKKKNNEAVITIEDNAGGIADDILPNIFNQYFTTKSEGNPAGIGLYTSKELVEKNFNGKLSVENTQNGAMFTIIIPLDQETE